MSEPKEKYFIVDLDDGIIVERKTLPEAFRMINAWLKKDLDNACRIAEKIEDENIIVVKGVKVEIGIEKKAIQT